MGPDDGWGLSEPLKYSHYVYLRILSARSEANDRQDLPALHSHRVPRLKCNRFGAPKVPNTPGNRGALETEPGWGGLEVELVHPPQDGSTSHSS